MNANAQEYLEGAATYAENPTNYQPGPGLPPLAGDVRQQAKAAARLASHILNIDQALFGGRAQPDKQAEDMRHLCDAYGVEFPRSRWGLGPSLLRLQDEKWWARKLSTKGRRQWEAARIGEGKVARGKQLYCTDAAVQQWRAMRTRNQEFLQQVFAFNDDQWVSDLATVAQHSLANPEVRRAEMFARIRGMEEYATERGDRALFITLTCPGAYHANAGARYNGASPRDAQLYLRGVWSRIRAALHRQGIDYYGMRVAEPHNDGCPHWHILLFADPRNHFTLKAVTRDYALREAAGEPGADKRRVTFEYIDPAAGSAVGYIAKYICKNIDGKKADGSNIGQTKDRNGAVVGDAIETAERVLAWASLWGIRQFQQVGGERVGPYRELRRIHAMITGSATLEAARAAADAGDFAAYMEAAAAACPGTLKRCEALEHLRDGDDAAARDALNQYGEPVWKVIGVIGDGEEIITRRADWRIMSLEAIHAAYEQADMAEAVEWWGELCELINLIRLDQEFSRDGP